MIYMYWNCNKKVKNVLYIVKFIYWSQGPHGENCLFVVLLSGIVAIIMLIRYLSSHIVLNLKLYEMKSNSI